MRDVDPALFPNVVGALRRAGIDPERELVPVAPAAHYMMGGIATDLDGRFGSPGCFAVGESSCTGLHGANRLASNSLSECFVFGARAARAALAVTGAPRSAGARRRRRRRRPGCRPPPAVPCGAGRAGAQRRRPGPLAADPYPLARLIAAAALAREESRGAHQRTDFPGLDPGIDGRHVVLNAHGDASSLDWR